MMRPAARRLFAVPSLGQEEATLLERLDALRAEWLRRDWRPAIEASESDRDALLLKAGATPAAIVGYHDALALALALAASPTLHYCPTLLHALHFVLTRDVSEDAAEDAGRIRYHAEWVSWWGRDDPDQGGMGYVAPPTELVPGLIDELCAQLNDAADAPPAIVAAVAHLNVLTIHPYWVGNGRLARILHALILARAGIAEPGIAELEWLARRNAREYAVALVAVQGGWWPVAGDAAPWVRFVLEAQLEAGRSALAAG